VPRYRYIGPGPIEVISGGEITRPGDEREFEEEPTWGPWELIEEAAHGAAGSGSEAAAQADSGGAATAAASVPVPAASLTPPAAPITPKGM